MRAMSTRRYISYIEYLRDEFDKNLMTTFFRRHLDGNTDG